jgi:hypothetical protein
VFSLHSRVSFSRLELYVMKKHVRFDLIIYTLRIAKERKKRTYNVANVTHN